MKRNAEFVGELMSGFSMALVAGLLCIFCVIVLDAIFSIIFLLADV